MEELIKNIEKEKVLVLKDLLDYSNGDVISKTIAQNDKISITLFSFTKGEGLSSHSASGDALLNILEGEVKVTINNKDYIVKENEEEIKINYIKKIYFIDDNGYFLKFNNKNKESILIKGNFNDFKVISIYKNNFIPFNENQNFYLTPYEFINKFDYKKDNIRVIYTYTYQGTYLDDSVLEVKNFFSIKNKEDKLIKKETSTIKEIKIKDVPNYLNNQYIDEDGYASGCTPTVAAMFFAYLEDNGYINLTNNKDLPLFTYEDETKVNNFIKYVGKYFKTTSSGGTIQKNIEYYYNIYLSNHSQSDYFSYMSKNYNEFKNAIENASNPVPISIDIGTSYSIKHAVLGIGYKEVASNKDFPDGFIVTNYASQTSYNEVAISRDCVYQFYFIRNANL